MRQPALAVVRQNHHVAVGQQLRIGFQLGRQHLVARLGLEIDAQQLLLTADDAQLGDGGECRVFVQMHGKRLGLEQGPQGLSGLVTPRH